ncbi:MAG: hypothetical protein OEW75_02500 [Cyclobacteriaceae bacterium]|nr:hypothetical protein [Cyclobacteriaceae bacterium]
MFKDTTDFDKALKITFPEIALWLYSTPPLEFYFDKGGLRSLLIVYLKNQKSILAALDFLILLERNSPDPKSTWSDHKKRLFVDLLESLYNEIGNSQKEQITRWIENDIDIFFREIKTQNQRAKKIPITTFEEIFKKKIYSAKILEYLNAPSCQLTEDLEWTGSAAELKSLIKRLKKGEFIKSRRGKYNCTYQEYFEAFKLVLEFNFTDIYAPNDAKISPEIDNIIAYLNKFYSD